MFTLDRIVPWGRSFDEYRRMFALTGADLRSTMIGCGDGPASFNAEATRRGSRVVSCDPIYQYDAGQIRARIDTTYGRILDETRRNADEFVWDDIRSPEELGRVRLAAMNEFLADFGGAGRAAGRYVAAALPHLPFADASFDLVLSSHLLFLYTEQLGAAFHDAAIREMCRVAAECRVFPLLALGGRPSPFVDPAVRALTAAGLAVSMEDVPYEFQRGGNKMMRIRR
ncbi:MAG: methyltransferase domain-containing protein [Acidobacteria bacterium]|nr:methyltransferase domain-containing protein [Acidobacteriota bacterium]